MRTTRPPVVDGLSLALQAASSETSTSTTVTIQASYAIVPDFFNGLLVSALKIPFPGNGDFGSRRLGVGQMGSAAATETVAARGDDDHPLPQGAESVGRVASRTTTTRQLCQLPPNEEILTLSCRAEETR